MMLRSVMKEYLNEGDEKSSTSGVFGLVVESSNTLPIEVTESTWSHLESPERLAKRFTFSDDATRNWFIKELIEDEARSGHHGKILIDGQDITVEVWTHDIDAVTELDIEYANRCDDIFSDVGLLGGIGYEYR